MAADHDHVIDTGKGEFDLSELGHLMPGMAEIMPLVGTRIWKCYYAGKAKNRVLAAFQLKEAVNLMEKGAFLRPKYVDDMHKFIDEEVAARQKRDDGEADGLRLAAYDALDGRLQARDPFGGLDRRQQALPVRRLKISHARYHSKGKSKKAKGNRRGEPCVKLTPCKCRAAQGILFTFAFCLFTFAFI